MCRKINSMYIIILCMLLLSSCSVDVELESTAYIKSENVETKETEIENINTTCAFESTGVSILVEEAVIASSELSSVASTSKESSTVESLKTHLIVLPLAVINLLTNVDKDVYFKYDTGVLEVSTDAEGVFTMLVTEEKYIQLENEIKEMVLKELKKLESSVEANFVKNITYDFNTGEVKIFVIKSEYEKPIYTKVVIQDPLTQEFVTEEDKESVVSNELLIQDFVYGVYNLYLGKDASIKTTVIDIATGKNIVSLIKPLETLVQ